MDQFSGCGGLGSWTAEFIARAGAASITLCDPGTIIGGLLVRQNYTEAAIGQTKAQSLATRLRAIRDDLTVTVAEGIVPGDPASIHAADLVLGPSPKTIHYTGPRTGRPHPHRTTAVIRHQ